MTTNAPDSESLLSLRLLGGALGMLAGGAILLGGFVLYAGEKSGRLVIFPWAGRLTMLVGVGVLAIGATLAGRRAALVLSVLMVAGGLALYAIGLALVEQLGTRLYQAFGLLTALVGLIAFYAVYGMDRDTAGGDTQAPASQ